MYADADVATCGAGYPPGEARSVEGGYLASGRWPYFSGITHAAWVQFSCRLVDADPASGPPFIRLVAHRDEVTVLDTWKTGGMCGTGSHDAEVRDLFIPTERSVQPIPANRYVPDDPIRHPAWLLPKHLGVPLGLVHSAHEEVMMLARERTAFRGSLRGGPADPGDAGGDRCSDCRLPSSRPVGDRQRWQEVCETGSCPTSIALTFGSRSLTCTRNVRKWLSNCMPSRARLRCSRSVPHSIATCATSTR